MRLAYYYDIIPAGTSKQIQFDFGININKLILFKLETDSELVLEASNLVDRLEGSQELSIIGTLEINLELNPQQLEDVIYFKFRNDSSVDVKLFIFFKVSP